jgi:PHD/YefM family antitoxin component YafN of YafNO toxin-antitoxin module
MPVQTTYTQARARLAALLDDVVNNRDIVIIAHTGAATQWNATVHR